MKIELAPGIGSISGKSRNMQFRTYRRPDGSVETRAYLVPKAKNGKYMYKRKTPVSEHEMQVRAIFSRRQARVRQLIAENPLLSKKEAWAIAKKEITA